jgi:hypothetical protein
MDRTVSEHGADIAGRQELTDSVEKGFWFNPCVPN